MKTSTSLHMYGTLFFQGLKAEGAVEDWLVNLEDTMVKTMKSLVKSGIADYETQTRKDWILSHCSQV